jgi:putative addiction module component (TIGR02574 family)
MAKHVFDFSGLTTDQRLKLIGQLWDSLDELPLPAAETRAELERRAREADASPGEGVDAPEAIARLRRRLR